jgi:hypothetical protein
MTQARICPLFYHAFGNLHAVLFQDSGGVLEQSLLEFRINSCLGDDLRVFFPLFQGLFIATSSLVIRAFLSSCPVEIQPV